MKTFGFSNFLLFHPGLKDLSWSRDDLQDLRDLVLQGPGKQEAGDCLLKPWFQHLPGRWTPQEVAETSMRVYGMLVELCLWPKLRANRLFWNCWSISAKDWPFVSGTNA